MTPLIILTINPIYYSNHATYYTLSNTLSHTPSHNLSHTPSHILHNLSHRECESQSPCPLDLSQVTRTGDSRCSNPLFHVALHNATAQRCNSSISHLSCFLKPFSLWVPWFTLSWFTLSWLFFMFIFMVLCAVCVFYFIYYLAFLRRAF